MCDITFESFSIECCKLLWTFLHNIAKKTAKQLTFVSKFSCVYWDCWEFLGRRLWVNMKKSFSLRCHFVAFGRNRLKFKSWKCLNRRLQLCRDVHSANWLTSLSPKLAKWEKSLLLVNWNNKTRAWMKEISWWPKRFQLVCHRSVYGIGAFLKFYATFVSAARCNSLFRAQLKIDCEYPAS